MCSPSAPAAPAAAGATAGAAGSAAAFTALFFGLAGALALTFGVIYLVVSKIEKSTRLSRKRKLLCKCLDELKDENSTNKINCSQASTCTQGICDENQINSLCHSWNKELSGKTGKLTQSWNNWCKTKVENFTELS